MPPLLQLQKLLGKGDGEWKKVSLHRSLADQKITSSWKKCVLGHPIAQATSYCLLPDTFWLRASKNVFKAGHVKFANSLSPPCTVKQVRTGVKAAKGLKRCWAKVKGVNPPELPNRKTSSSKQCSGILTHVRALVAAPLPVCLSIHDKLGHVVEDEL